MKFENHMTFVFILFEVTYSSNFLNPIILYFVSLFSSWAQYELITQNQVKCGYHYHDECIMVFHSCLYLIYTITNMPLTVYNLNPSCKW